MTDRQQLKEALEYYTSKIEGKNEHARVMYQAAQAWYDFPERLDGMRQCWEIGINPYFPYPTGFNSAIDQIKEMVKPSPE